MAQMFNTLQASLAILVPFSLAQLMETYTSIVRIQALLLLGTTLYNNFLFEPFCGVFDKYFPRCFFVCFGVAC